MSSEQIINEQSVFRIVLFFISGKTLHKETQLGCILVPVGFILVINKHI